MRFRRNDLHEWRTRCRRFSVSDRGRIRRKILLAESKNYSRASLAFARLVRRFYRANSIRVVVRESKESVRRASEMRDLHPLFATHVNLIALVIIDESPFPLAQRSAAR